MEDLIKLNSRGENSYLKRLKSNNGTANVYKVKADINSMRLAYIWGKKVLIILDSPNIVEGEVLKVANAKVKSIDFIEGYGYTITFYKE